MSPVWSDDERRWMIRAIELARPERTHPNPRVGCVIADPDGKVVGEGIHRGVGTDHAEQDALRQAGSTARGATVVVSLEPCAHYGRTPPCAQALVEAGVARVVAATLDPDRRVSGRGMNILRAAGIDTSIGLMERAAVELDSAYHHHRRTGRPHVQAIRTAGLENLDPAVRSDLGLLEAATDLMATRDQLAVGDHDPRTSRERLVKLGEQGRIEVGVRDGELIELLGRQGLVDAVTVYSTDPEPDLDLDLEWDGAGLVRTGRWRVGSSYRLDFEVPRGGRTDRVRRGAEALIPTRHGDFRAIGYESLHDGRQHVALVKGGLEGVPLVRVHSECLTGDVFGSLRCDCGFQLDEAMRRIREEGAGMVLYLRGHEGRGIGLMHKLAAYALQEGGRDTVEANLDLGLPADRRDYQVATLILQDLGVTRLRLLTNNPAKQSGIEGNGLRIVERVSLVTGENDHNRAYLRTKVAKLGHLIELDGSPGRAGSEQEIRGIAADL